MFTLTDMRVLLDYVYPCTMPNGWRVIVRAEWVDATINRPHGVSYALILEDEQCNRLLGFDNSHAYDGAGPDEPFDHEHRASRIGQTFRYGLVSAGALVTEFTERCEAYCRRNGVEFEFERERGCPP